MFDGGLGEVFLPKTRRLRQFALSGRLWTLPTTPKLSLKLGNKLMERSRAL
jgi:hypothetical protein